MEWTEREINLAKTLQDPDMQGFLRKIFTEIVTNNGEELAKNIVALDDAEYGRIMKVNYLSKIENKARINLIAKIAKMTTDKKSLGAIAPK